MTTSSAPSCAHSRATSSAVFPPPTTTTRPSFGRAPPAELHRLDPRRRADDARARPRPGRRGGCPRRGRARGTRRRTRRASCAPVTSRPTSTPVRTSTPSDCTHSISRSASSRVQLVRRDAGRVEPARAAARFSKIVAWCPSHRELRRERERRRPRAHARDALLRSAPAGVRAARAGPSSQSPSRSAGGARWRSACSATPRTRTTPRRAPRPGRRARTSSRGCSARRWSRALPRTLPLAIRLMNAGMSIVVGHALVHGASAQ